MIFLLFLLLQTSESSLLTNHAHQLECSYFAANSDTFIIDFDRDDNGNPLVAGSTDFAATQPYANLFSTGSGVVFSTDNPTTLPLNLYDSEGSTGQDPDLERNSTGTGLWAGGNLTNERLDNLLIINKNTNINTPNDHGGGGVVTLDSDLMLQSFFFSFIDLDAGNVGGSTITFTNTVTNETATISFSDLEGTSTSVYATPNVEFDNRHGNQVHPIRAADLGISEFNRIAFDQAGSGGIGSMVVQTSEVVCSSTVCLPVGVSVNRTGN